MKKYLYLLLFFSSFVNAQIVNIPDANFKAKLLSALPSNNVAGNLALNSCKIDINSDNEIQVSEALQIGYIDVSNSNIVDLTGIEQFVNLITLICNTNQIATLNVSNFNSLTKLVCNNNQLTTLDVSMLSNLQFLNCKTNLLTNLNVTNLNDLTLLDCSYNQINNLTIVGLPDLSFLNCQGNQLLNINLAGLTSLQFIYCGGNQLSSLNLTGLSILQELYCNSNQILSLNLTGYNLLTHLDISTNLFTSIDLTGLTNLQNITCNNNSLTNLNLNGFNNLQFLNCKNNQIQNLDLNNLPSLQQIFCNNNSLTSLLIKNGVNESILNFSNNPNLQFICADLGQIVTIQNQLISLGMNATVSNTYCSFTPGGNYNIITGSMIFDANNNGCDASDSPQPNIKLNINDGTNQGATFTNNAGNYNFYTQAGNFTLTPNVENPTWFTISPTTATIPFANNNNNTTTQNFCISANGVHPDLEITIASIIPARPGFDAVYQIVYKNKGNQMLSQAYGVNFFYNQNLMSYVSSTVTPSSTNLGAVSWDYANLQPFESSTINVILHVNAPTDANPVNIGDVLTLTANILAIGDENNGDNLSQLNQTVVGSFDPNDISCLEGTSVSPAQIGNYLHYNINFENTGTSQAESIVVKVEVDPNDFDINSLQMLASSNDAYVRIEGNKVEFIFNNIMLDTGGHGNILLKIRSKNTLVSGDMVAKRADIFFDYNAPIDTGFANTTFQSLNNSNFQDVTILVYPNPTNGIVIVEGKHNIKSVQLYDVQGRLLETKLINSAASSIDISEKSNGIYFLKISSDKGIKVEKVVKQ